MTHAAVSALVAGCAREATPPGGPPDRLPPIVISSEPDTFSTVDPFRSPVIFRFSERISERPSAGTLDQAVVVSPASGEVRVSHGREGLTVRVLGGFEAGRVYRLTVRPVIQDMFGNSLQEPYELFFSTGPEFTPNVVAGSVVDRLSGTRLPDVRVDAAVAESDVVHTSLTDSAGIFALRYIPPGEYVVSAYIDRNRNGEPDFTEPQGTRPAPVSPTAAVTDTVILLDVPLLPRDTTSARLARVTVEDSISLRVSLDDYLDPERPLDDVRAMVTSDSVDGIEAAAVLHEHELEAYRRAMADSITRARAVQDSLAGVETTSDSVPGVQADSTAPGAVTAEDSTAVADPADAPAPGPVAGDQPTAPPEQQAPGTGEEESERPLPQQTLIVILDGVLVPEVPYQVEVSGITNIQEVGGGGGTLAFTRPAPPPEDTTQVAGDSVPGDTISLVTPADTVPPGDTLAVPGDSIPRDTIPPPAEDSVVRDTIPPPGTDSVVRDTIPPPGDSIRRDTIPPPAADSVGRDTIPPPGDSPPRGTAWPPASAAMARRQTIPIRPFAPGRFPHRLLRQAAP